MSPHKKSDKQELKDLIASPHFRPTAALALAQRQIAATQLPEAYFLAFMAFAELFAESGNVDCQTSALAFYNQAIAIEPRLRLFRHEKYLPERLIGVGGFAYVFCVQTGSTHLALKVLKHRARLLEVVRDEFTTALRKLADCSSDHIVRIIDPDGLAANPPFYTMEYFPGVSLRLWLTQTKHSALVPKRSLTHYLTIVDILTQVARGLDSAHACGVLHLDLKPENILMGELDQITRVKLTDFNFLTIQRGGLPLRSLSLAQMTIEYSAPEVRQDFNNASPCSDIYSLGLIGIEMLAGSIEHRSILDGVTSLAYEEPQLAVLLLSCIDHDPKGRPQSCAAIINILDHQTRDLNERADQQRRVRTHTLLATIGKAALGHKLIELIFEIAETVRGKRYRQVELVLSVLAFAALAVELPRRLVSLDGWRPEVELEFLPVFLVTISFAFLQFFYYHKVVFRFRFWRWPVGGAFRFLMSSSFFPPILLASWYPAWWPFCSAVGVFLVAINNLGVWLYARQYPQYAPTIFGHERQRLVATLSGYWVMAFVWAICLGIFGVLITYAPRGLRDSLLFWQLNLVAGTLVALVNVAVYFTKVGSGTARRLVSGLALEFAIRART